MEDLGSQTADQSNSGKSVADATGGDPEKDINGQAKDQSSGEDIEGGITLDGNIPPELEETRKKLLADYHSKTQKLADDKKQTEGQVKDLQYSHTVLQQLLNTEWFKKAYENEKSRKAGVSAEDLTDEAFEAAKNDKRAFLELVKRNAEAIVESRMGGLKETRNELKNLQKERELDRLSGLHKDFRGLYDKGSLDEFLEGRDFESAYAMYKLRNGQGQKSDIEKEAERILRERKAGAVERGGSFVPPGVEVRKAKNLDDALNQLFAAADSGKKIKVVKG